ncbi:MND1-interacting protein 1 [Abeliophyllum distichum]|uniref:MND1-interacting protein 1 n=1 Tax=Abeliophyllum distichum TaxID=126358 RepID=A0ABD1PAT6_9LAMI
MAGSKRGKHLVNKGKSKSKESERVNDRQETSSSKPDMIQKHSSNPDERKDSKDKNPLTNMNFDTNAICGCKCNIGEDQLEKLLHEKFKRVYNDTFEKLLALGYKREIAKKAMLMYMGGSTFKDFLQKSAASLDSDDFNDYEILRKDRKGLKNTNELLRHTSESMMAALREKFPNMKRYGAMWNQAPGPSNTMTCPLHCKDQTMSSISFTESLGSRSYTKDDVAGSPNSSSSNRNIPSESNIDPLPKKPSSDRRIVALDIKKDAITKGSEKLTEESNFVLSSFLKFITDISNEEFFQEWLETCPDDSRNAVIVDLVRSIIDLKERVKEGKEWVRKTGVEVANELSLDLFRT